MTAPTVLQGLPATELLALQQRAQTATFVNQGQWISLHILLSLEITSQLVLRLFKLALVASALVQAHHLRIVRVATLFLLEHLQQVSTAKLDALQTQQETIFHLVLLNPPVQHLVTVPKEHLQQ